MSDIRKMQVGQLVDFCISYNERIEAAQKAEISSEAKETKRKASQNDINAYFG